MSSLSVLVRKRINAGIEMLFQTMGDIQGSLKYELLVCAESGVHRKQRGMGSQGGFHLHCPLFSMLPAGYNEPNFPLEDSFKTSDPIFYKNEQRDINTLMKEN